MSKEQNQQDKRKALHIGGVIKRFFKINYWMVKKGGFPYGGYCTYNWKTKTILDTGLPKWQAEEICKELNAL
jgi:hypothetical protein